MIPSRVLWEDEGRSACVCGGSAASTATGNSGWFNLLISSVVRKGFRPHPLAGISGAGPRFWSVLPASITFAEAMAGASPAAGPEGEGAEPTTAPRTGLLL